MTEPQTIELLYKQARLLIRQKDLAGAGAILKQILEMDENYKDTSRLLMSIVQKNATVGTGIFESGVVSWLL